MWTPIRDTSLGLLTGLSGNIDDLARRDPASMPDLSREQGLLLVSDYGGDHRQSSFVAISVLVTGIGNVAAWDIRRRSWRQTLRHRGRRMAFRKLTDKRKLTSLPGFLNLADGLDGLLATVLLDKNMDSILEDATEQALIGSSKYPAFTPASMTRTLQIVSIVALFASGLSSAGQDIIWITDEDEIAANEDRLTSLTRIFANYMSHCLTHDLRHLRCGTTKSDDGSLNLEDLAAIPDLAAGATTDVLTTLKSTSGLPPTGVALPLSQRTRWKTRLIWEWMALTDRPLRRFVLQLEGGRDSTPIRVRTIRAERIELPTLEDTDSAT